MFPHLESQLTVTHAKLITELEKEISDYPEHVCCSCEQLHQRKSVTRVNISDNLGSDVWEVCCMYVLFHAVSSTTVATEKLKVSAPNSLPQNYTVTRSQLSVAHI